MVNRFSDRRISQKKLFGFRIWQVFYTDLRILLIQRIADLSNILAQIVDLALNLVRILDCDFIVELLADPNLDKIIVGSRILLQIWADRRICIPLFTPPPPPPLTNKTSGVYAFLGALGSKYYQHEERSETNPLVYGRKRENQRYQSYQGQTYCIFYNLSDLSTNNTISLGFQRQRP